MEKKHEQQSAKEMHLVRVWGRVRVRVRVRVRARVREQQSAKEMHPRQKMPMKLKSSQSGVCTQKALITWLGCA